jgi:dipeptidyl aminopeptidase/acylaminoacyl peptidase
MPWDGTELWVAEFKEDGSLGPGHLVAGGIDESVFQPEWSPDGMLYFVSDRSGWWNLYRWDGAHVKSLVPMSAEFGRPLWTLGQSTYALESERTIVCSFLKDGYWNLAVLDTSSLKLRRLKTPFADISNVRAAPGRGYFIAASPTDVGMIATVNIRTGSIRVVYRPKGPRVDPGFISIPKHISFPTTGRKRAYAFFYEPKNKNYASPRGQRPPLVVISHGGPTSFSPASFALTIEYWTSRGFAVLNVNYRGGTGYGRRYMKELEGTWGIVDVDDCTNGALHLARLGKVDGKKLVIRGGSAGGYTTLCALTFKKVFAAGASYYGVSDLEGLEKETHKFESHYCDRIVAPYPERRDVYLERSALYHTDKLSTPLIFFQGLEDVIVLPNQAEKMVEALREKGVPVAYVPFEGEQHGFRKAESIIRAYEAELYFYSKILGFPLAEKVRPVEIQNLRSRSR